MSKVSPRWKCSLRGSEFRRDAMPGRWAMLALLPCLLLLLVIPIQAQRSSGSITGTVVDESGAALADTTISITQVETNLQREVKTNDEGTYAVPELPIGTYRISAARAGFKETVVENVTVNVATNTRQDLTLQVGAVGERVEIVASEVQIETQTGAVGDVVTGDQVRELPLNGRSFVQLTQLQPGVSAANGFDSKNKGLFSGVDFSVNGNTTQSNLFLTDGANNNDTGSNRTILLYPSIEAIAEFKILRNSYGPEFGQASGAVITLVTRGGENQFHGSLFYFGRNDVLNARDFFANSNGTVKDKLRRNDYGGSLGGPIVKDRLFFFYSQEFNKEIRGFTRFGSVPTEAERNGDFSNPRSVNGIRCSGSAIGGGRPGSDTQVIPQSAMSPAGQLLVQLYPLPNFVGSDCNNWSASTPTPINFREENIRIDSKLNGSNQIFGRYTQDHWENPSPILLTQLWGDDPFPTVESSWTQPSRQAAVKLTSTLSSTSINEVQFSYSANRINVTRELGADLNQQINEAIPGFFDDGDKTYGAARSHPVFWGGITPFTSGGGPALQSIAPFNNSLDIYSFRDDFSKVAGNHILKTGFLYNQAAKDEDAGGSSAAETPQFWGACCGNNSGNVLADVLTRGSLFGGSEANREPVGNIRYKDIEFYFGDTWKARSNLTLELGARYSLLREPYDANNRIAAFDPAFYDPARPSSDPCNGLVVPQGSGITCSEIAGASTPTEFSNRSLRDNNNHMLAPRLGIAYDVFGDGKMAIRGGFGQFFQRERVGPYLGLSGQPPFVLGVGYQRTLDGSVINVDGPPNGSPSRAWDSSARVPYTLQYNILVNRQLYRDGIIEVGYVGNRSRNQLVSYDINQPIAANRTQAAFAMGGALNALRPYSNFGSIYTFSREGEARYNSLQAMFKTRLTGRSQIQVAYTFSKSIANAPLDDSAGGPSVNTRLDTYNPDLDRGRTGIDRPHIFVANAIFYLPGLNGTNGFVKNVFGGWEYATIVSFSSGTPLTPNIAGAITFLDAAGASQSLSGGLSGTGTGQGNILPNRVEGVGCSGDDELQIVNPAAYTLVGRRIGEQGNGTRGSCRGPATKNFDMSFYKNFTPSWLTGGLGEGARIQFRLELFNAFNTTQFRGNSLNLDAGSRVVTCGNATCSATNNLITGETFQNTAFGRPGSTRGPREIQYALKLVF